MPEVTFTKEKERESAHIFYQIILAALVAAFLLMMLVRTPLSVVSILVLASAFNSLVAIIVVREYSLFMFVTAMGMGGTFVGSVIGVTLYDILIMFFFW